MKIALSVWSCHQNFYNKTWSNADFIDFVGTTQAAGVELLSMFWNADTDIPQVQEALLRNNLKLACFGACNNLAQRDEAKRRSQVQDILTSVDMARLLGAKVVRIFSGDRAEGLTFEEAKVWIIEGLKEAAAYAEEKGITLCLENHGHFAGKASQVSDIIREVGSDSLRSTFDTGNFLLVDENPSDAIRQLLPLVSHVHLKDFRKMAQNDPQGRSYTSLSGDIYAGQAPGEGDVDLPFILSQLKAADYDGWLAVEYEGNEDQQEASTRSIQNLNKLMQ
ncbi:sugar phosphate isomerase/epimerase family protein [Paenibacillus radicis (ex Xue et al. 2023)]|uniref:Sugar phosphate isomerase/epimerase n=1 Tax=Paenibacillus radicis (ex Xue et al. 2023) TaxID=2972489 RepID=A0ABT1YU97_9BACL|nr:sugar phosphate isomerase/epimerase [Paenibacillus radicis (ex Xue et al. 2023)]MCR8635939.1 sugar phosphate isomerase/epimerase [Paenibacillus radicis (ex Xue et al. 2023)]